MNRFETGKFRKKLKEEKLAPPDIKEQWHDPLDEFDPGPARDAAAEELKNAPDKKEKKRVWQKIKSMPEYWRMRAQRMKERQDEEILDDWLGVYIKKKTLYHGSYAQGITEFKNADQTSFGQGVYLAPEARDAVGYAHNRARSTHTLYGGEKTDPILYEATIEDMTLLDLQWPENLVEIAKRFFIYYQKGVEQGDFEDDEDVLTAYSGADIEKDVTNVFKILLKGDNSRATELFTEYVKSLGYDGIISKRSFGKKESDSPEDIGSHLTYVIFDPKRVYIHPKMDDKETGKKERGHTIDT